MGGGKKPFSKNIYEFDIISNLKGQEEADYRGLEKDKSIDKNYEQVKDIHSYNIHKTKEMPGFKMSDYASLDPVT
jgi:hypothetical protein